MRAMLCEAALQARRPSHPLDQYFLKLCTRRNVNREVGASSGPRMTSLSSCTRLAASSSERKVAPVRLRPTEPDWARAAPEPDRR